METPVSVKPSLAIAILKSGLSVNVPMFLWGPPGIGKSQIVAQVAADLNLPLIDIRAVLLDPVDLRGVPSVENGTTRWNPPNFLPTEGEGVLFFGRTLPGPRLCTEFVAATGAGPQTRRILHARRMAYSGRGKQGDGRHIQP